MKVVVPPKEAATFREQLATDGYRATERDYKVAVHLVLSALLSEPNLSRDDLPSLIANLFHEATPDLDSLGIGADDQAFIRQAVAPLGGGGLRSAMANLAGGKWGLAQFMWIPRAIEFDLGPSNR